MDDLDLKHLVLSHHIWISTRLRRARFQAIDNTGLVCGSGSRGPELGSKKGLQHPTNDYLPFDR
jgi:hypothetical protein